MKIKLRSADRWWSKYIRTRDRWTCQRCYKKYPENSQGLHCSHFHGRRKESVRFDEKNTDAICWGCHAYFHANPKEHYDWKLNQLGQKEFDLLTLRANTPKKPDDKLVIMICKQLLKEI